MIKKCLYSLVFLLGLILPLYSMVPQPVISPIMKTEFNKLLQAEIAKKPADIAKRSDHKLNQIIQTGNALLLDKKEQEAIAKTLNTKPAQLAPLIKNIIKRAENALSKPTIITTQSSSSFIHPVSSTKTIASTQQASALTFAAPVQKKPDQKPKVDAKKQSITSDPLKEQIIKEYNLSAQALKDKKLDTFLNRLVKEKGTNYARYIRQAYKKELNPDHKLVKKYFSANALQSSKPSLTLKEKIIKKYNLSGALQDKELDQFLDKLVLLGKNGYQNYIDDLAKESSMSTNPEYIIVHKYFIAPSSSMPEAIPISEEEFNALPSRVQEIIYSSYKGIANLKERIMQEYKIDHNALQNQEFANFIEMLANSVGDSHYKAFIESAYKNPYNRYHKIVRKYFILDTNKSETVSLEDLRTRIIQEYKISQEALNDKELAQLLSDLVKIGPDNYADYIRNEYDQPTHSDFYLLRKYFTLPPLKAVDALPLEEQKLCEKLKKEFGNDCPFRAQEWPSYQKMIDPFNARLKAKNLKLILTPATIAHVRHAHLNKDKKLIGGHFMCEYCVPVMRTLRVGKQKEVEAQIEQGSTRLESLQQRKALTTFFPFDETIEQVLEKITRALEQNAATIGKLPKSNSIDIQTDDGEFITILLKDDKETIASFFPNDMNFEATKENI